MSSCGKQVGGDGSTPRSPPSTGLGSAEAVHADLRAKKFPQVPQLGTGVGVFADLVVSGTLFHVPPLTPGTTLLVLVLSWCEGSAHRSPSVPWGQGGRDEETGVTFLQPLSSIRVCVGKEALLIHKACLDCYKGRGQSPALFFLPFSGATYQLTDSPEMVAWGWWVSVGGKMPEQAGGPAGQCAGCWAELPCSATWLHDSMAAYRPWDAGVMWSCCKSKAAAAWNTKLPTSRERWYFTYTNLTCVGGP